MKRGPFIGLLLAGSALLVMAGCGKDVRDSAYVRCRVTVEVEDSGVTQKASSVWSWPLSRPATALASSYNGKFVGEAVAVDLSDGPTLFALLRSNV